MINLIFKKIKRANLVLENEIFLWNDGWIDKISIYKFYYLINKIFIFHLILTTYTLNKNIGY